MSWIVTIAGWLQIVAAIFILISARSAMHETTAAVAIGLGVVALGLGRLLQYREAEEAKRDAAAHAAKWEERKIR